MGQYQQIDLHTHTRFSFDSEADPDEMFRLACEKGFYAYAVTDHSDHCSDLDDAESVGMAKADWKRDTDAAFAFMMQMKERYRHAGTRFLAGIELGEPLQDLPIAERILKNPYDIVVASVHNAAGEPDFYDIDYQNTPVSRLEQVLGQYFSELLAVAKWGGFDTLAHMTYPYRYLNRSGICIPLSRYDDLIAEIFRELVRQGKALELNTSGVLRTGCTESLMPNEHYLRLYRKLGGKYLTVGSDSHAPETHGGGIPQGIEAALRAGFEQFTVFENRRPRLVDILR